MRTIIAGGRYRHLGQHDKQFLDRMARAIPITEVVNGGARGIDYDVKNWANHKGIPVVEFPADWKQFQKAAGPIRNKEMAEYAEVLIAFPGGSGTQDMVNQANALGLIVYERNRS